MNELVVLCLQYGLERLLPFLPLLARPSIRLLETEVGGTPGCSRLGGLPDVNPYFRWPRLRDCRLTPEQAEKASDLDAPLLFLGQLNWAQLKSYDLENMLPSAGGAIFFVGQGPDAVHSLVATVNQFAPRHLPLPQEVEHVLPLRVLKPQFEWTLPQYGFHGSIGGGDFQRCFFDILSPAVEFIQLDDSERKAYDSFKAQVKPQRGRCHRVLGHADYEQNPMQLELECRARNLPLQYETYLTLCDPSAALTRRLKRQAFESNWRLAFQLGHFVTHDGLWGDAGTHYFWSKRSDLSTLRPNFMSGVQFG